MDFNMDFKLNKEEKIQSALLKEVSKIHASCLQYVGLPISW